jgi:hypothetical protein
MNKQQQRTNGHAQSNGPSQGPRDELDVADEIVSPSTYEDLLQQVNLGTGVYDDEDVSMQMRSFRKGMIVDVAFDGVLFDRAIEETKIKLADNGFKHYNETREEVQVWDPVDEDRVEDLGRTKALRKRGEEIWDQLSAPAQPISDKQAAALAEFVGIDTMKPVFWRLLAAYHEASKSREGHTQDNFFQRVKKNLVNDISADDGSSLPFRSGGGS